MEKFNKIQQKIYNTFCKDGNVWAESPRQVGKTDVLVKIAADYISCNKKVAVKTANIQQFKMFKGRVVERLRHISPVSLINSNLIRLNSSPILQSYKIDLVIGDECNVEVRTAHAKHIACCWTPNKKILRFSFKDLDLEFQNKFSRMVADGIITRESIERDLLYEGV